MSEPGGLAAHLEHWRPYLTTVAYNMLGSVSEAEDAVQLAWLRLSRSDADAINDMRAWLTTVVGRIREPLPTLAGAEAVAGHILQTAPRFIAQAHPVLVNGAPGLLFGTAAEPISVLGFTVTEGRIAELDLVADPAKLRHLANQP